MTMTKALSPPPIFGFTPTGGWVQCPAFTPAFKTLAVLIVTLIAGWALQMWLSGTLTLPLQSIGWLLATVVILLLTAWHILKGTTQLDTVGIEQTWLWRKRVDLCDLAYAKLIHIRGLEWLIAPRLYTRTFSNKLCVFYAASPTMLIEFGRLIQEHERSSRN